MDGRRFDRIAKALAATPSRRAVAGALTAGALGLLGVRPAAAACKPSGPHPRSTCNRHPQCCSGRCFSGRCCTPKTCAGEGVECETLNDGCGGILECGTCDASKETCQGGVCACVGNGLLCLPGQCCADQGLYCSCDTGRCATYGHAGTGNCCVVNEECQTQHGQTCFRANPGDPTGVCCNPVENIALCKPD